MCVVVWGGDVCVDDPYLNFGLDGGRFITLDRQQVGGAGPCVQPGR
jgi:hypothetical protein